MNHELSLEMLRRIDEAASGFERAWTSGNRTGVEAILADLPPEIRRPALRELLALELELRRRAGERLAVEEFLERFPAEREVVKELFAAPPSSAADVATSYHAANSGGTHATGEYTRPDDVEGAVMGPYTLERQLGAGGMGVVWVARQSQPVKRRVALKLIKRGMDSRDVVRRFEQERQALAVLDHPHIARVLDAGIAPDGRPFFAMELVNGLPLTQFCDEARLETRQRLEIFQQICFAVQHAHQKGIIHRDLKPANILITLVDGRPVPKVIDFGVAKALGGNLNDDSLITRFGAVIGTLEYMAPEQAGYSGIDIDTRADIYALGVILYELLTGLRPFDAATFRRAAVEEMIRIIREEQPFIPSKRLSTSDSLPSLAAARQCDPQRLTNSLRGDLDWIAMKCLEKDRGRRYRTADQLADEIRRYLADEPVEAGPPDQLYLLRKFIKRHRGRVLAGTLLGASVLVGLVVSLWQLNRAVVAERSAVRAESQAIDRANEATTAQREALLELAKSKVHQARGARRSHRYGGRTDAVARLGEARDLYHQLARQDAPITEESWRELRSEAASAWLLQEIETELLPTIEKPLPTTVGVADFVHQRFIEFPAPDAPFTIRDLKTGDRLAECLGKIPVLNYAEFSDDGNWLYTVGAGPWLEVWNVQGEKPVSAWSLHGWLVAAQSRTHPLVVVTTDGKTSTVYDRATGREVYKELKGSPPWGNPFSPDGRRVVLYRDGGMFVLDLETREETARWSPASESVRWNNTGDELLVTIEGRELQFRDAFSGALLHSVGGFRGGLRGVIDGKQNLVFTHDYDRSAQLMDARTGRRLLSIPFGGYSLGLQMSTHGERVNLLDRRGERHAAVTLSRGLLTEFGPGTTGVPVVSRDGSLVAASAGDSVRLYDLATGRLLDQRGMGSDCEAVVFDGNDALWASNGWRSPARVDRWPLVRKREHGVEQVAFGPRDRVCQAPSGAHWRATPDATLFAVGGDGNQVFLAQPNPDGPEPAAAKVLSTRQSALRHIAVTADGRWIAAGGHLKGGFGVYDREKGSLVKLLSEQGGWGRFSPDGELLAVGYYHDRGEVFRTSDWRRLYVLPGAAFNFSPDSRTLVVNDGGSGLLLLDSSTGRTNLGLEIPESTSTIPACFTHDGGTLLATAGDPPRVMKIDLTGLRRKLTSSNYEP
jgi:serine/threonine protein kinase/WD40 repeat protein